jgi:uncharacterized membrane protein
MEILTQTKRIESIDLLRGLVMIIMALDHTRDFFHAGAMTADPLDLNTTTPVLFFTRWVTHYCAPIFVFLSGVSAYLQSSRKSKKELSLFLIKRGVWLIFIELAVINFLFSFDIFYTVWGLQVIWAIGISMFLLGILIWLPFALLLAIGFIIVLGHNALDIYEKANPGPYNILYNLLHHFGVHSLWGKHQLFILYPFLPWTGLMILGYCLGKLLRNPNEQYRKRFLTITGLAAIGLFIALRFINIYGDPVAWSAQKTSFYSFHSFINTNKYPPSLFYMCMTIGPALLFIAWWGNMKNGLTKVISVYGRVAFFYYILHFFFIHLFSAIAYLMRGHTFSEGIADPSGFGNFIKPGEGVSLGMTYVVWIAIVALLYPFCKWYDKYKTDHKEKWWLSYL